MRKLCPPNQKLWKWSVPLRPGTYPPFRYLSINIVFLASVFILHLSISQALANKSLVHFFVHISVFSSFTFSFLFHLLFSLFPLSPFLLFTTNSEPCFPCLFWTHLVSYPPQFIEYQSGNISIISCLISNLVIYFTLYCNNVLSPCVKTKTVHEMPICLSDSLGTKIYRFSAKFKGFLSPQHWIAVEFQQKNILDSTHCSLYCFTLNQEEVCLQ